LRYKKKKELRMRVTELEAEVAKLEKQRWRDSLTGLLMREGMKEALHAQVELMRRQRVLGDVSSVIVIDLDDFSRINNEYGHPAGDAAIVAVVKVIKDWLRDSDVFGRWGGDEFVGVMLNTPKEKIRERLERLRDRLSKITLADLGGLQIETKISASIGVAQLDVHPNTGDELWAELSKVIAKADSAMYEGKKNGKGHIVVAE
jgi:diguanylate cyclase (GGDEF)-like protein